MWLLRQSWCGRKSISWRDEWPSRSNLQVLNDGNCDNIEGFVKLPNRL